MSSIIWRDSWLLLGLVPIVIVVAWWWRIATTRSERALQLLRGMALVLLVCAIASPSIGVSANQVALVVVRDRSLSTTVSADTQNAVLAQLLADKPADALVGIVDVAADAQIARVPSQDTSDTSPAALINRNATALADGITQAAALLPAGYIPRIIVLSDGLETKGRVVERIESLRARGVQVDVYPLDSDFVIPVASIQQVTAPQRSQGQGDLIMTVDLFSSIRQPAQLVVRNQDGVLQRLAIELTGTTQQLIIPIADIPAGWHRLEVVLQAEQDDTLPDNQRVLLVQRQGAPRILVLADPLEQARPLQAAIEATGSTVTMLRPADVPARLTDMVSYDVIVLSDTSVTRVPESVMELIVTAVSVHGRGFLWIGGAESLGAGGFRRSPLQEIAAVSLEPYTPAKQKRLTMYLVIDRSGSMDARDTGVSRLDIAKEAAYQALTGLNPQDNVGVVFFDDGAAWALTPQVLPDGAAIANALGRYGPGGGTSIRAGLQLAHASRNAVDGDIHHVILLSDGVDAYSNDDIARAIQQSDATLSTIALGDEAGVPTLQRLAALGGGVNYVVQNAQDLPRIFLNETVRVSGRDFVEETVAAQVVVPDALPIGMTGLPVVRGYNRTTRLADSQVLLQIDNDTPLWALRLVGRGQSAVWASDFGSRWGTDWVTSDAIRQIMPALLSPLLPQTSDNIAVGWHWYDDLLEIDVATREEQSSPPTILLTNSAGETLPLTIEQRTSTRWFTRVRDVPSGEYVLQVESNGAQVVRGIVVDGRSELRNDGQGVAILTQLANQTGGAVLSSIDDSFWVSDAPDAVRRYELAPWLILVATMLFVGEIALRRLPIRWPTLRKEVAPASPPPSDNTPDRPNTVQGPPPQPPSRVQRLQKAKRRALD
ncbi:MAG: VWA domain-containing protein [Chloroflexi bacterium]|nr:VWA domain-containing protein [Chloroflexota bacterium]